MSSEQSNKHGETAEKAVVKRKKWPWILLGVLAVLIVLGAVGASYVHSRLEQMKFTQEDLDTLLNEEIEIEDETTPDPAMTEDPKLAEPTATPKPEPTAEPEPVPAIRNYMLFGVDSREVDSFAGLSDVMIMVTVDTQNKSIKLTSFMRDILVSVEGYGKNKLNIVFKYKGPEEAVKTIEEISGVQIDGYGIVNFYTVAKIIDILGGVDIENLTAEERDDMNFRMKEINKIIETPCEAVTETGSVHLDGMQAVTYMRIRAVGRGDYTRTERQRTVIATLFKGLKDMNLVTMMRLVNEITPLVKTDLSTTEILSLAKDVYWLRSSDVEQLRIPLEEAHYMTMYNNVSVIVIDEEANKKAVREFIYGPES